MALAQPTNLQVQELTPFATLSQSVTRENAGGQFATLEQRTGYFRINAGGPFATLSQAVIFKRFNAGGAFVTLSQGVSREDAGGKFASLRQWVAASAAAAAESPTRILLDGQDITGLCSRDYTVTGSEGDNKTASIEIIKVPKGTLNIPGYQGREISISRLQDGVLVPLFQGWIDEPRYRRYPARILLTCSDQRNRRIGNEDRTHLRQITGGLFSAITQRDDATGADWVAELLRTVEGSLDYTAAGALRYRPWAIGAADHSLTGGDVHYRELETDFAVNTQVVNRVPATLEYRYYQRNTLSHSVSLGVQSSENCKLAGCIPASTVTDAEGTTVPQILPTKAAIYGAAQSVSGWSVQSLGFTELPPDGWYRNASDVTQKVAYGATEIIRETRAAGADVLLERYISQPKRETYTLTVEAPQSIEQYGVIEGNGLRVAAETRIDPAIFEERGCSVIADPDDRRADVTLALECLQRMAAKRIREGHRANSPAFRYHPKTGRPGVGQLLPVEIGDVVAITADEITTTGFVTEYQHREDEKGDAWTDIKLAVSRVDSGLVVTEDWTLPAAPLAYKLTPPAPGQASTPDCPAPTGLVAVEGDSRIEPDGTVIIVAPAVDRSKVDEIRGERPATYNVAIPKNPLSVEVI